MFPSNSFEQDSSAGGVETLLTLDVVVRSSRASCHHVLAIIVLLQEILSS